MKAILLFLFLTSCARTDFFYNGQKVARFEGDMAKSHFTMVVNDKECIIAWDADTVNHSEATKADSGRITAAGGVIGSAIGAAVLLK